MLREKSAPRTSGSPAVSSAIPGSHGRDLTLERVDQVGAVASVDQQQFLAWGEDAAALVDPQPSAGAVVSFTVM